LITDATVPIEHGEILAKYDQAAKGWRVLTDEEIRAQQK
jgi:hypothetical protein